MSHLGRAGPPNINNTYSLRVNNITFRTSADDLLPLFDKYGKVVDVFIARDRRTRDSLGFAFVRYKYADEAQLAIERLDGKVVDGRKITIECVECAYGHNGPNTERISEGRILEPVEKLGRSRRRSPRPSDREHRKRQFDVRKDGSRNLRISDSIEYKVNDRKAISSKSKGNLDEQLNYVKRETQILEDQRTRLKIGYLYLTNTKRLEEVKLGFIADGPPT